MDQSNNGSKIILGVIVVLVVIGGLVYLGSKHKDDTPENSIFGDGKMYQNQTYNFSFEYPKNWAAVEARTPSNGEPTFSLTQLQPNELFRVSAVKNSKPIMAVLILKNPDDASLDKFYEARLAKGDAEQGQCRKDNPGQLCISERSLIQNRSSVIFAGENAIQVTSKGFFENITRCTFVEHTGNIYSVCFDTENKDPQFEENYATVKQIFSSFRFF